MLDETTSVGRENLDPVHVAHYDGKEDAHGGAEVGVLLAAGLTGDATVVELGAGTGQFALAAADAFRRVVAVDPSPVMRRLLAEKARERSSPVEIVPAGFLTYEHRGDPPDAVYSRYALHHLPDFWKVVALARIRRMLRPGGLFRLWDVVFHFPPDEVDERVEGWCATGSSVEGEWNRADLEEHIRDEHSTFTWLLEPMIRQAGFAIRDVSYADDRFSARYVLVAV
jgi:SAM-dependent methyltransferase